ncbi:cilia- and flagella-associated protein 299 isoform 1 [Mus musculus]|uniref:Cilia- and flagella-associated protein 299 n=2 Tax=Mus musculus TaxID=10090 RepID=CF299_MOUSE|nr:cilia- and flagella-associated protein 299 isoform 1 [Mus musculus]Q810M1.1 RecName: Full=Cilia- and flagella-associated protein 299 [Mus musculus]AAH49770.1 RIKEN cDNA 1700007G11 gene [Mus musculus]|eukprot:NP_001019785.1 cilia- and flagella-associated protein 299 [Mus musculus]
MDQDEGLTAVDNIVTQFNTYEDFLDSQITTVDLYYLEDESLARQLVELGYRGTGEIVKREDFEARKAAINIARQAERTQKKTLTSAGKELHDDFLKALAMREEDNRAGKLSTVIFIRDRNPHGQEVSGYIDYAHRLKSEDFEVYFNGKRRLLPRTTDMSFYNWDSHIAVCNSSPNYQVIADNPEGLLFKYKRDRKILNVDPKAHPGDNSTRIPIQTDLYAHVVLFDHVSRRKT